MKGYEVLKLLANGQFLSGQQLGQQLGISRTAIWNHIQAIRDLGLEVFSVQGKGYKLAEPLELLELDQIRQNLSRPVHIELFDEVDSTNRYLLQNRMQHPGQSRVCLAERQTAGRGRRGRQWVSPFGSNVYLSLSWQFSRGIGAIEGLSLVVALAILDALEQADIGGLKLKWPNDIYFEGRKLGGILLEMAGEASGPCQLVIGIGLNVNMPAQAEKDIDQAWADLRQIAGKMVSRNALVAQMLNVLLERLEQFEQTGFAPFRGQWQAYDLLRDQIVDIHAHDGTRTGIARGIDESGALLVEIDASLQRVLSGDVSVRLG